MSAETYLDDTEPAVRHLFKGLDLYDNIRPPSIMQYVDDTGEVKMSKKEADDLVQASQESIAVEFSRATLAGAILQVAYVGLKEFSINHTISPQCQAFGVEPGGKATKFCIGWTVHDIPVGLLIYSGRNQYNHWEDGWCLHKVPKKVFRHANHESVVLSVSSVLLEESLARTVNVDMLTIMISDRDKHKDVNSFIVYPVKEK